MDRLSFLDQVVHKISTTGLPSLNMQGAGVVDPSKSPFEVNGMILAEHIAARLSEFPILRKKLMQDSIKIADMRLVDDPAFDVWDHITFATLPSPGDAEVLDRHLAKFSAQQLDPDKPLWRFEIIEGLAGGKIAIAQKISHAIMDGMAAMRVLGSIFDMEPKPPAKLKDSSWEPEPVPTKMGMLRSALKETAQRFGVDAPKTIVSVSKDLTKSAKNSITERFSGKLFGEESTGGKHLKKAYPTSLNRAISSDKRSIGFTIFELDKLKAISKALDCKINDISLVMASEALASYFEGIQEKIDFDLILCMPVNIRNPNDKAHGNALALSMINARNTVKSIPERLESIKEQTAAVKASQSAKKSSAGSSVDVTTILSPILIDLIAMIFRKTQPWDKVPVMINAVVTNVPGPPGEMYLTGMPIEYQIPMIPVYHKGALSIGVNSMGNNFSFGFHGCGKIVKQENMHFLLEGLDRAFQELQAHAFGKAKKPTATLPKPKVATAAADSAEASIEAAPKVSPTEKKIPPTKKPVKKESPAKPNAAKKTAKKPAAEAEKKVVSRAKKSAKPEQKAAEPKPKTATKAKPKPATRTPAPRKPPQKTLQGAVKPPTAKT